MSLVWAEVYSLAHLNVTIQWWFCWPICMCSLWYQTQL